jgi:hypothetical protein
MDSGQWTIASLSTHRLMSRLCTGIISDLPYGSLLGGQPRIFGPDRLLYSDYREMARRNWGNPTAHV